MYIILLNKLRFYQISCSRRSSTSWQYGCQVVRDRKMVGKPCSTSL